MELNDEATETLDHWITSETWQSGHDSDWDRWYAFVNAYQKHHGYTFDEVALSELIARKAGGNLDSHSKEIVKDHIHTATRILDFLKLTQR